MKGTSATDLARFVREQRLRAGLTQEALAERAGLSPDSIGALERGLRRRLYPHTARAIADALDLSETDRTKLAQLAHGAPRSVGGHASTPAVSTGARAGAHAGVAAASVSGRRSAASPDVGRPRHNLPAPLTRLIGRERELAQIEDRLARMRLLTLTGVGGIGKTRLAIEAAWVLQPRFPDGVWLVDLAPVADPALVLSAVAAAVGVPGAPGQTLLATLTAALHDQCLLLVLDNCEHVLDAAPEIGALLGGCPMLTVLATSRAPLHLTGEYEVLVPPLPAPGETPAASLAAVARYPAVELFLERAAAVNTRFELTPENAPAVAAICARLDGLPLALELAAARVKLLPPALLLTRLDQRLRLLTGGAHDRPIRQRTLRAAIAWSYDLLSQPEQALFRRLGVFAGGFTLAAAEAVCADEIDPSVDLLDTLAMLVDKSLLQRESGAVGEADPALGGIAADAPLDMEASAFERGAPGDLELQPGEYDPRFTMLETIREFALEQLVTQEDAERSRHRHARYYLELMEHAEHDLQETAPVATVRQTRRRLTPEHGNLRAALDWAITHAQAEPALRLAASLCALWVPEGSLRVARRWLEESAGSMREARRWLERSLALEAPAPDAARAKAFYALGRVLLFQWDDLLAERDAAIQAFERGLSLYRRLDDRRGVGRCLLDLGAARFDQEDVAGAGALFEESLALHLLLNLPVGLGWSLIGLGRVALARGEHDRAAALFEDAFAQQRAIGYHLGMAAALDGLGLARQAQRVFPDALRCFEEAVTLRRAVGAQSGLAMALQRLAVLLGGGGELGRAAVLLHESLILGQTMDNPWDVANGLLALGGLAGAMGQPERGARLFGAGEALIDGRGLVVADAYRGRYARAVEGVRRALGEEAFAAAWADGQTLSPDEAIAEALQVAPSV
jgi:predicted ATPase/transcriptional regulator with XRE-family HTH domain